VLLLRNLLLCSIIVISAFFVCLLFVLVGAAINSDSRVRQWDLNAMVEAWRDNSFWGDVWESLNS
jgi:ABC-type Fe3+ transport system permease subunit